MRARSLIVPMVASTVLAILTTLSVPAAAQPLEVASGEDLQAWQALEHRRLTGEEAVIAYRAFVERYADSSLAEMAWGRLVALGQDEVWTADIQGRQALEQVRQSWLTHQAALRVELAVAVQDQPES